MKLTIRIALCAVTLSLSPLALACDYPARPSIPDGATATTDDMKAARDGVKEFLAAVDEYLRCIESEEQAAIDALDDPPAEEVKRREDVLNKKFDAANEEKALVGEQFNQQVRAYNAQRQPSE